MFNTAWDSKQPLHQLLIKLVQQQYLLYVKFDLVNWNINIKIKSLIIWTSAQLYAVGSLNWQGLCEVWRVAELAAVAITDATLTIPQWIIDIEYTP